MIMNHISFIARMGVAFRHSTLWRYTLNPLIIILVILLASLILMHTAKAAAGDLDLTFGSNGKVTTDFGGTADYLNAVVLQTDGKIVVAGHAMMNSPPPGSQSDFALARYNPDGALDTSFGNNGRVTTHFNGGENDGVSGLALQPDGKIVAAGSVLSNNGASIDIGLARYNSNGSLDTTFGNGGKVTTDFTGSHEYASAVVLQPDGKIVVAGQTGSIPDIALARYNPDGSLDPTFGSNGEVVTHFNGGYNVSVVAYDLARQPDGKLVIVGVYIQDYGVTPVFALARYKPNGALDSTFGSGGELITNVQGYAEAIALQPDGKIIAGGHIRVGYHDNDFELARFNSDGSLDTGFGNNGKVTTTFSSNSDDIARAVALQPDGKIIAAGATGNYPHFDFALVRYTRDGQLDPSFGNNGKIATDFFGSWEEVFGVAFQPDGKILVAGDCETPSGLDFGLARYLSPSSCTYSLSSTSLYLPATGGDGSLNITTGSGCNWTATANDSWIIITSANNGSGNATLTFEVRENFTGSARSGTVSIAGQTFTVHQGSGLSDNCEYSLSPTFNSVPANGGSGTVNVITAEDCAWQATSNVGWLAITSNRSGIGNGAVGYSVAANPTPSSRKGTITLGRQTFSVKQKGR